MIGAICINATMFAATIAWLTFIYIWKDQIRHDKTNLIGNQPLTSWILLQNTRIHLNFLQWKSWYLTPTSLNFPPIYQYLSTGSGHCLVPARRQVIIWTNEVLVYSLTCPWWVKLSACTDLTIWYGARWVFPIMTTRETCSWPCTCIYCIYVELQYIWFLFAID